MRSCIRNAQTRLLLTCNIQQVIYQLNQIFHYTSCIAPNRATSLWCLSPRHCDCRQHSTFPSHLEAVASRWKHYGWFDLPKIWIADWYRSRDQCVTAWPTEPNRPVARQVPRSSLERNSEVQISDRSNRTQSCQRPDTAATFLRKELCCYRAQ